MTGEQDVTKRFEPKTPIQLNPPKDDPIKLDYLEKCDGKHEGYPILVGIKGRLFDVSNNKAYQPGGGYAVFAGHDASRALAKSSLKPEECVPEWEDLDAAEKKTLEEWYVFFSKRYNIVGLVEGATNMG